MFWCRPCGVPSVGLVVYPVSAQSDTVLPRCRPVSDTVLPGVGPVVHPVSDSSVPSGVPGGGHMVPLESVLPHYPGTHYPVPTTTTPHGTVLSVLRVTVVSSPGSFWLQ